MFFHAFFHWLTDLISWLPPRWTQILAHSRTLENNKMSVVQVTGGFLLCTVPYQLGWVQPTYRALLRMSGLGLVNGLEKPASKHSKTQSPISKDENVLTRMEYYSLSHFCLYERRGLKVGEQFYSPLCSP